MKARLTAPAVLFALSLASCSIPALTPAVRQRHALTDDDLRRIQFYTSDEIALRRELPAQDKAQDGNALVVRDGVLVEEVIIPARTPGMALRIEGDYILIGFSPSAPAQSLWFGLKPAAGSPPDLRNYELVHLANEWNEQGPFTPRFSTGFMIRYDGAFYRPVDAKVWSAHLLYDLDETYVRKRVIRKPAGWELSDGIPSTLRRPIPAPPQDAGSAD